ncbi:hypothetical protein LMG27198_48960 [Methylocystis echinoides]|uniref:Uncharacterized protein n=1 Tax=Methylocystis echinoides TaxID=29468 RepID=A0A9W6LUW6_9HYPH|nr:hypothetical protein LMG27198_48960 [Methylocystis echinoides]
MESGLSSGTAEKSCEPDIARRAAAVLAEPLPETVAVGAIDAGLKGQVHRDVAVECDNGVDM